MDTWQKQLAEAGDMHSDSCCVNSEGACDSGTAILDCCDNMRFLEITTHKALEQQRKELVAKMKDSIGNLKDNPPPFPVENGDANEAMRWGAQFAYREALLDSLKSINALLNT